MSGVEYIRYAYIRYLLTAEFDALAGNRWLPVDEMQKLFADAFVDAFKPYGFNIDASYESLVYKTISEFKHRNVLLEEGDQFTGLFLFMPVGQKDTYIRTVLANNDIHTRIERLGAEALHTAVRKIATTENWAFVESNPPEDGSVRSGQTPLIPAADRIVTLNHNQQVALEEASTSVIDSLKQENSIDGDADLRMQLLGELNAGRELIKYQSLRAYLLYETVISALSKLIDKFGGTLLAEAAKKFLDLLIEHVFK